MHTYQNIETTKQLKKRKLQNTGHVLDGKEKVDGKEKPYHNYEIS